MQSFSYEISKESADACFWTGSRKIPENKNSWTSWRSVRAFFHGWSCVFPRHFYLGGGSKASKNNRTGSKKAGRARLNEVVACVESWRGATQRSPRRMNIHVRARDRTKASLCEERARSGETGRVRQRRRGRGSRTDEEGPRVNEGVPWHKGVACAYARTKEHWIMAHTHTSASIHCLLAQSIVLEKHTALCNTVHMHISYIRFENGTTFVLALSAFRPRLPVFQATNETCWRVNADASGRRLRKERIVPRVQPRRK